MTSNETIEISVTPEFRGQLEGHLSVSAHVLYLHARFAPGVNAARLDRHVRAVFGRHGELMRRLAQ
jgi:hypothetical protein